MESLRLLWRSTVGKKAVMALTGMFMALWLVAHLAGNLLVFAGPAAMDGYGAALHSQPWLLWPMRIALLGAVALHAAAAWQLGAQARKARPQRYAVRKLQAATLASRLMQVGGGALALFIPLHLLHLTWGAIHPQFQVGAVYHNVVTGLRSPAVALAYIAALVALGLHLDHGLWSWRRSLGLVPLHSTAQPLRRPIARLVAVALWLGFIAIPIAAVLGFLG